MWCPRGDGGPGMARRKPPSSRKGTIAPAGRGRCKARLHGEAVERGQEDAAHHPDQQLGAMCCGTAGNQHQREDADSHCRPGPPGGSRPWPGRARKVTCPKPGGPPPDHSRWGAGRQSAAEGGASKCDSRLRARLASRIRVKAPARRSAPVAAKQGELAAATGSTLCAVLCAWSTGQQSTAAQPRMPIPPSVPAALMTRANSPPANPHRADGDSPRTTR